MFISKFIFHSANTVFEFVFKLPTLQSVLQLLNKLVQTLEVP